MSSQAFSIESYEPSSIGELEQLEYKPPPSFRVSFTLGKSFKFVAIGIMFALSFTLGVIVAHYIAPHSEICSVLQYGPGRMDRIEHHCGESLEEAQANGCGFDYLSGLWLPKACSRSYEAEFIEMPGTGFYGTAGADLDDRLDRTLVELPFGTTYYTTRLHHVTHCLLLWLRNNDNQDGIPVAYNAMSLHHQRDCAQMILELQGKGSAALWEVAVHGEIYTQSC
jgi:hypothetical protein